jgi:hypothetical protein
MISYSNGNKTELDHVLDLGSDGNSITIDAVEATKVPWEGPAMNMIWYIDIATKSHSLKLR